MRLSFDYKGTEVTYYLTYKKAKAISIQVTDQGQVQVTAPRGTSVYAIMDKVKGNAPWIINELYNKNKPATKKVELLDQYTYLGKNYKLEVVNNPEIAGAKVKMMRGKFIVETADENPITIRTALVEWYKQKVNAKIKERFKEYETHFEVMPEKIEVVDDATILFRGNNEGFIMNAKLGMVPVEVMDYVLLSGLCRLNTSNEIEEKQKLEAILPGYEKSVEWLEENKGALLL